MRRLPPALLCLAAACGDPLAPLPDGGAPRELTYVVDSGLAGVTADVRLAGDTVAWTRRAYPPGGPMLSTTRRVPSADEWGAFWAAVRDAGVRRWPASCTDDRIADSGGFTYTLAWGGTRLTGSYYAQSPTARGRCSGDEFDDAQRFGDAVLSLAGGAVMHVGADR